ncbi:hypothetical protein SKAU_G00275000 [Synaphobranchus kaupii]|uniref:Uncharacterized protein n=1 Tax=Synaphobranchus kaupii TaxID=118154 RepID=A0A9Q1F1C0_SYNKA|nr:hypothetical protein SKAU_G00275000 [Synaphobranchus kaupii]
MLFLLVVTNKVVNNVNWYGWWRGVINIEEIQNNMFSPTPHTGEILNKTMRI